MARNPQAKTSGGLLKVTITIAPDQMMTVDRIADKRHASRSSIIRLAIDNFLSQNMHDLHKDVVHTSPRDREQVVIGASDAA